MRIVHLATSDLVGGAARAAFRLHEALLQAGDDSLMLVRRKTSTASSVHQAPEVQDDHSLWGYILQSRCLDQNRTGISNTWFSLGWPGQDLSQHPLLRQADILNLHWISDFLSSTSVAQILQLGIPIVWTLHDQRAFTGGCHFSAGCEHYQQDCSCCPQLVSDPCALPAATLRDQRSILSSTAFTLACPSRWMAECARRSAVFSQTRIAVMPNGINPDTFKALPQTEARAALNLPLDGLNMLFGSDYGGERRKGSHELATALEHCSRAPLGRQLVRDGHLRLLCFGRPDPRLQQSSIPVHSFGFVNSDETLNRIYAAADLFLMPSTEDNLPNTVLEAMSSGTPVAAFNIGGVPDMVVEGETGRLAAGTDPAKLGEVILSLLSQPALLSQMRTRCRARVVEQFSAARQADTYRALYHDLLQSAVQPSALGPRTADRSEQPSNLSAPARAPGPGLQAIFACLLRQAFAAGDDVLPPAQALSPRDSARRARFHARIRGLLCGPGSESLDYHRLQDELEAALGLLGGRPLWRTRFRQTLRRWRT